MYWSKQFQKLGTRTITDDGIECVKFEFNDILKERKLQRIKNRLIVLNKIVSENERNI